MTLIKTNSGLSEESNHSGDSFSAKILGLTVLLLMIDCFVIDILNPFIVSLHYMLIFYYCAINQD